VLNSMEALRINGVCKLVSKGKPQLSLIVCVEGSDLLLTALWSNARSKKVLGSFLAQPHRPFNRFELASAGIPLDLADHLIVMVSDLTRSGEYAS